MTYCGFVFINLFIEEYLPPSTVEKNAFVINYELLMINKVRARQ